jgi:AraC-like DNA-binding protein
MAQVRQVDWPLIEGALAIRPTPQTAAAGRVQETLLASQRLPRSAPLLEYGWAAVEGIRSVLELDRIALFLRSKSGQWLSGLIGTNALGALVDERHIRHVVDPVDEQLWAALIAGKTAFEVYDNAPHVAHQGEHTRVIGRGWFVKTPIVDKGEPLGLFYNDAALTSAPFDVEKQELLATFAALFAPGLRAARDRASPLPNPALSPEIADCLELLGADPGASLADLAQRLGMSAVRLSRTFQREVGKKLQDYRTEQRLQRFFALVDSAEQRGQALSLMDLALAAGFGSYSQFHRVFSARFGSSPKLYLNPEK